MSEQNNTTVQTPPVSGQANSVAISKRKTVAAISAGAVIVLVLGSVGFGVYRAYAKSASDKFTLTVARVLSLPAVRLQDKKIPYTEYMEDLQAIRVMKAYDMDQRAAGLAAERTPGADLTEQQMTDQVLWRLVNNEIVRTAAEQYSITITDDEVKTLKDEMLKNFESETALELELVKRYGWTIADYEKKVVRPFILQSKLAKKITEDPEAKESIRVQAQKVLEEAKNDSDFAALAKQYSGDGSAQNGGDLGWFSKGQMVPDFEKAAFSLKKGAVYPTLVETEFGYHIIKLYDRRTEKVKNSKGQMENQEQVRASHILFRFADFGSFMEEAIKKASPKLYLKVHNPFAEAVETVKE